MSGIADRLKLLRQHPELNGIDFIEIVNTEQTVLRIHFVNDVTTLVGVITGVTISGGDSIPVVPVLPIDNNADWDLVAKTLTLRVDAPGDFSTYKLALQSSPAIGTQSLDPYFARRPFSFKVGCPALVDCEPAKPICPEPNEFPPIDYLAKDYDSFRQALLEFSARRYPEWKERSPADFGIMFMEALAAVADDMSYLQDRIAAEAWLETATERRSIVRHARLVDYEPRPATASRVLLRFDVSGNLIAPGLPVSCLGPDGSVIYFETGTGLTDETTYPVRPEWNSIVPHWWDDSERCLHIGAREMWVVSHGLQLKAGQTILLDTAPLTSADPPIREVVTLIADGEEVEDPLASGTTHITRLVWRLEDALQHDHDLTRTTIHANLVPATQGQRRVENVAIEVAPQLGTTIALTRTGPDGTPEYLHTLRNAPLVWLVSEMQSGALPQPEAQVVQTNSNPPRIWRFVRQMLDAEPFDDRFTVDPMRYIPVGRPPNNGLTPMEYDGSSGDTIRFGNGTFGTLPEPQTMFRVTYRVGGGAIGNVAADSIRNIEPNTPLGLVATRVTNPFPATGGADAETDAAIKKVAPQAFRSKLRRAVRREDYERIARYLPWVQSAGTSFRYTGSWLDVYTAADSRGDNELSLPHHIELFEELDRVRLAGYDSHVLPPRYVALDISISVCVKRDAFQGDVREGLFDALSALRRADGSLGFFHVDRFVFGQGLWRSALEAAIQRVRGVDGVRSIQVRKRRSPADFKEMPAYVPVGRAEVLRVDNNPSRPERGSVDFVLEGGK